MERRNFLQIITGGLVAVAIPNTTTSAEKPLDKKTKVTEPDKKTRAIELADWDGQTFGWLPVFETKEEAEKATTSI